MTVNVFAGVAVSDYARAVTWFEAFFGVPATFEAHETESVWSLSGDGHVYVVLDAEHAGHSKVTLFLDDLDAFVSAAADRGLAPDTVETYDNGVRKTTFRDPDGNEIGLGGAPLDGG